MPLAALLPIITGLVSLGREVFEAIQEVERALTKAAAEGRDTLNAEEIASLQRVIGKGRALEAKLKGQPAG